MLTIHVENVNCKLSTSPSVEVVEAIREELRYKNDADNPFTKKKFKHKNFEIAEWKHLYHKGSRTFPTGLLNTVEEILKKFDVKYTIQDTRPDYPILDPLSLHSYILRDYQITAEKQALIHKNCMVRIATGGGKTAIMASICAKLNGYKRVVFVRRQMLMAQTIKVFERELGHEVGQLGAGVVNIKDLTIAMVPTVARAVDPKWSFTKENDDDEDDKTELSESQKQQIKKFIQNAECIIIDECHSLGADTAQLVTKAAEKARYRLGFSATTFRDDGKDILLSAATGPKVVDIDASFLIDRDYLVPPHIYFFQTPPVRIPHYMQGKYQDVYKEFIVENQARNQLIIDKTIEAYNRFEKILILVRQVEHGKILEEILLNEDVWVDYLSGKDTPTTRENVMSQFQARSRSVLIASDGIMSEGIDLPQISCLVNASAGRSAVTYYQKVGRALRLCKDKKRAIVIDFLDQNIKYMKSQSVARIRLLKTEPAYKLKIQTSTSKS